MTAAALRGVGRPAATLERGLDAALAALAALALAGVLLLATGLAPMVDRSESMAPAIRAGDLIVGKRIAVEAVRPGEIVTFPDPGLAERLLTHRVVEVRRQGDTVAVTTRGDANAASERWSMPAGDSVRRMVARVPAGGRPLAWIAEPAVRVALLLAGTALLAFGLRRRGGAAS